MRAVLGQLEAGTRFRVDELGLTGALVKANECRAVVRLDAAVETVEFIDRSGAANEFVRRHCREISWSPAVLVTVLSHEELPMSATKSKKVTKKTTANKAAPKKADGKASNAAKSPRAAKKTAASKLSQIDAAAKVLAEAGEPMTTKAMVEAMGAKGYWQSPGGKTPHATLYSALTRDIQNKGQESRFAKVDRGQFKLTK